MNFHFIRYLWNELCVFISPSLWRGDIKHTTSFINTVWNENSFQILFITCLTRKNVRKLQIYRVFLPILLRKTRQRRAVTYDVIDELRRLSLSKSYPALCHKLIYEIAIFHSINGETCDKRFYVTMLRLYDVRYIMNLWICIILCKKKKKVKQPAMTVRLTFTMLAWIIFIFFFAVIIISYNNVFTKLKECIFMILHIAELTKTLLPGLLNTKLLGFCRSTRI